MKASEFKAKCLKVMDEVAATGEPVTITKNGVAISQLVQATRKPGSMVGALKGSVTIRGNIISPIEVDGDILK